MYSFSSQIEGGGKEISTKNISLKLCTPETPETPNTPETPKTPENPGTPQTPDTPNTPEVPLTPETPKQPETQTNNRLPQTGNNANKAMIGLGMGTLLSMFGLAGINKRRVN